MTSAVKINTAKTPLSTPQSIAGENADVLDMAALKRSTRYVSGDPLNGELIWVQFRMNFGKSL
jgi:hypothetical protein